MFFKHLISALIYVSMCICINILKCVYHAEFSREIEPTGCAGGGGGGRMCVHRERQILEISSLKAGRSKICKAGWQRGNSGRLSML